MMKASVQWSEGYLRTLLGGVALVVCGLVAGTGSGEAVVPGPGSQQVIAYDAVSSPMTAGDAAQDLKPIALGAAAEGGENLRLSFGLGVFAARMDVYLAVFSDVLGNDIFTITSDGAFHSFSAEGLVPWATDTLGNITGDPFGANIPVSVLPAGTYYFYLLTPPTGGDLHGLWYLWTTSLSVLDGVFMAGTQPGDVGRIENLGLCTQCHGANYDSGPGNQPDGIKEGPYAFWRGSMMANAARDPLFWALLAVQNKIFEPKGVAIGDFCLRCHVPKGWLEGRSEPADGSLFETEDLHGVQCDFCHRMVDPFSDEGKELTDPDVEAYRNAQYVVSDIVPIKRGPYDDAFSPSHQTQKSDFHLESEFCATCHEISNPFYNNQVQIENTYSEWKHSAYGDKTGADYTSCQGCHMPRVTGWGSILGTVLRDNIPLHEFVGGNTWGPLAVKEFDATLTDEDKTFLDQTVDLATQKLREAASLETLVNGNALEVKITNLTGHRLPTGYTEGRRVWVNVKFFDAADSLIKESGAYDSSTGVLTNDAELEVYEAKPGLLGVDGFTDGPSFHFALNNHLFKDNRIPPKGFTNAGYASAGIEIIGATYADGQNWDTNSYVIPEGAARAEVTLLYQTTTKEFVEFLRDENIGNKWDANGAGGQIYDIWDRTGKAAPVSMAVASASIP